MKLYRIREDKKCAKGCRIGKGSLVLGFPDGVLCVRHGILHLRSLIRDENHTATSLLEELAWHESMLACLKSVSKTEG